MAYRNVLLKRWDTTDAGSLSKRLASPLTGLARDLLVEAVAHLERSQLIT